ncbi:MAG TPA: SpoIIE family protein phosphatase [Acidimicrobiales bacterium]|nr:SpoIIE family protein phosphatase [Acidimicrobiales bacterium]
MSSKDQLATVRHIAGLLAAADGVAEVAGAMVRMACDLLGASGAAVGVLEGTGRMRLLAAAGPPPAPDPSPWPGLAGGGGGPLDEALAAGVPFVWPPSADGGVAAEPVLGDQPSWVVLPLVARGSMTGVLSLGYVTPQTIPPERLLLLEVVAHQCTAVLDAALVVEAERQEREILALLGEGTRLMVSEIDPDEIVSRLATLAVPRLAPWCAVYVLEGEELRRVALAVSEENPLVATLRSFSRVPVAASSLLAAAFRSGQVQVISRVTAEIAAAAYPALEPEPLLAAAEQGQWSALAVPVKAAGSVVGVMSLVSDRWRDAPGPALLHAAEGLAARAGIALANADRFRAEQRIAELLTRALLPTGEVRLEDFETAARYLPAGSPVAGDWFELLPIGDGRFLVGVGDSAGHGIEAASLMAELRSAARAFAVGGDGPRELLCGLDRLIATTSADALATALYGILDVATGTVTWSSAGHLPPLAFGPEGAGYLATRRAPPLGCRSVGELGEDVVALAPGSGLVLFTDGVVERRRGEIDARLEALRTLVEESWDQAADALADAIIGQLCEAPEDDCCLVVLKRL